MSSKPPEYHSAEEESAERPMASETSDTVIADDGGRSSDGDDGRSAAFDAPPSEDGIYEFYTNNLFPAIIASLPILFGRIGNDVSSALRLCLERAVRFLLPWRKEEAAAWSTPSIASLWNQSWGSQSQGGGRADDESGGTAENSAFVEFMLRHFDTDEDGHISASELLHMGDYRLPQMPHGVHAAAAPGNWLSWFSTAWPAMDWKLGIFLWRTCGGLLLVIAVATIVPGRLHGYSGRIMRWPVLGLTYFMIAVELAVYTVIRMFIRLTEWAFATPKHRALRRKLAEAKSYDEWYRIASELDMSQKRDAWRREINDGTSYRYNWAFVNELMSDMRTARADGDSLMALAVLQQCTRKNVGGIMSEDLFSYTNTGEPKLIVQEFIDEVVTTLHWVTEQAKIIPLPSAVSEEKGGGGPEGSGDGSSGSSTEKAAYERELQSKVKEEKCKIYGSLIDWATLTILGSEHGDSASDKIAHAKGDEKTDGQSRSVDAAAPSSHAPPPPPAAEPENQGLPFLHREQVKTFLKRARAAYGRTALCLSGGAMMGNYHFGHVQALLAEDALPHIISGTSAGSVVAAMLCTRNKEELERDMRPEVLVNKLTCFSRSWLERIRSVYENGSMFSFEEWIDLIQWFTCGSTTFEEAYKKTGRVFCITLSATTKRAPPVLVNHITAPNVTIASAIIASAAVPGFIPPVTLQLKGPDGVVRVQAENKDQTYWDGSIEQDIPTSGLAEMLNCQFFVTAQCNPHIVPFLFNPKGDVGRPNRWSSGMREDSWRGGFLLSALEVYLRTDMLAKFSFLDEVEAAVGFFGTMFTQSTYTGSTTIVPHVVLEDFFKLFETPSLNDMNRYFQAGSVAAYRHIAMIKLHYRIAQALDECLAILESDDTGGKPPRRRRSQMSLRTKGPKQRLEESQKKLKSHGCFTSSSLKVIGARADAATKNETDSRTDSCATSASTAGEDDEVEDGGFDGIWH